MSFAELLSEHGRVPFNEAASWYNTIQTPQVRSPVKLAALTDPPDEQGLLEGKFEVPVENMAALLQQVIRGAATLGYASTVYQGSLRGLGAEVVRRAVSDWSYAHIVTSLSKKVTVLVGPPHIGELPEPPPFSTPRDIARTLIRGEQELIHMLREASAAAGENMLGQQLKDLAKSSQDRIYDLWAAIDPEVVPSPEVAEPRRMAMREQAETPEDEALESPAYHAAEETVGVEAHPEVAAVAPTAEPVEAPAAPVDIKIAGARMRARLMKLADGDGGTMDVSAPMATTTAPRTFQPTNYLNAELIAQKAQNANEARFYQNRAQLAEQAAAQTSQQMEQVNQQLQQVSQQASQSQQAIQQSTQQAMAAQDEALKQTQVAANMRMGMQLLRSKMLEVASQDPAEMAAQQLQGGAPGGAPTDPSQAPQDPSMDPGAGTGEHPVPQGPAADAAGAQPAAPPASPPGPDASAQGASKVGFDTGALKGMAMKAAPWAAGGAVVGGAHSYLRGQAAPELRKNVEQLEQQNAGGGGTFFTAMRLMAAKAQSAEADFGEKYPGASVALGALRGAVTAGATGPRLVDNVRAIAGHMKDIG